MKQFLQFVNDKYDNVDGTHHYEISQSSGDTSKKINIGTDNTDYPTTAILLILNMNKKNKIKKEK